MKSFYYDRALEDTAKTIRLFRMKDDSGNYELVVSGFFEGIPGLSITNSWGGGGGSIVSSLIDTVAGMTRNSLGQRMMNRLASGEGMLGKIGQLGGGQIAKLAGYGNTIANLKISSIESLVKQYEGTSTNLELSQLSVVLLYDVDGADDPRKKAWDIIQHLVGSYYYEWAGEMADEAKKWLGIQKPPNGYTMDPDKAISETIKGTFKLEIGNNMTIDNILVSGVNLHMSNEVVRKLSGASKSPKKFSDNISFEDTNIPLYVEMNISFEMARELTDADFKKILGQS